MKFKDLPSINEQEFILRQATNKIAKEVKKLVMSGVNPASIDIRINIPTISVTSGEVDKTKQYFEIDLNALVKEPEDDLWEF